MRIHRRRLLMTVAPAMGVFLLPQSQVLSKPADERKADSEAISAVLRAQQTSWNRGDVPSLLVGYWRPPELTFSRLTAGAPARASLRPPHTASSPPRAPCATPPLPALYS